MVTDDFARLGLAYDASRVHQNLSVAVLVEEAVKRGEAVLSETGSLCVTTGKYTGRSPKDRFIVDTDDVHSRIAWGDVNVPISRENYERIRDGIVGYLNERDLFVMQMVAGAERPHSRNFEVVCELASQALFVRQLLIRPTAAEASRYSPNFMLLAAPGYKCDPAACGTNSEAAVVINFEERVILVCGTSYSGEIKKSVFSVMNYLLPVEDDVLPMHCSCNMNPHSRGTTVLFGLSGTGKTTLSAAKGRKLIGDDEHGWSADHVFNIEGGCYAKTINITPENEPQIFSAIRFGSVSENVVVDPATRKPDYEDVSLTENGRVAYPVEFIPDAVLDGVATRVPDVVIFLTADAFGVLPPISKLTTNAAMYHFLTGFTSKVAGTERGITEPQPTFSALFGEPFMPLDPNVYARMLGERIERGGTRVYLVNTGWTGGPYGVGHRMKLSLTRKMVNAAMSGMIEAGGFTHDERFGVEVPNLCLGVSRKILNPRNTWKDQAAYDEQAEKLAAMFEENARTRHPDMADEVREAGPHPLGR